MASINDLIEASDAALAAFNAIPGDKEHSPEEARFLAAFGAAARARPSTLPEIALWLRWALRDGVVSGNHLELPAVLAHIATQLEATTIEAISLLAETLRDEFGATPDPSPDDELHSRIVWPSIQRLRAVIGYLRAQPTAA